MRNYHAGKSIRRLAVGVVALAALLVPAPAATGTGGPAATSATAATSASDRDDRAEVITLPGAAGAEGIAAGDGDTFFAGDLLNGDIFRGDIDRGTAEVFLTAPEGRAAVGMKVDRDHDLLFVAGGATGQAYVYDLAGRDTEKVYELVPAGAGFINDVTLTRDGAWFTNSRAGELYRIPIGRGGTLGDVQTLVLEAPAGTVDEGFNLNGIAAADDGDTLVVAHTGRGALYAVDPDDGSNREIEVADSAGEPVSLTNVDGILIRDDTVWAVQNFLNQVSRISVDGSLDSGVVEDVITSEYFDVPTTAALFGDTLALVNAKFSTPGAASYEVVLVGACPGGNNAESDPAHPGRQHGR